MKKAKISETFKTLYNNLLSQLKNLVQKSALEKAQLKAAATARSSRLKTFLQSLTGLSAEKSVQFCPFFKT